VRIIKVHISALAKSTTITTAAAEKISEEMRVVQS
jgi:hypothetical protein